MYNLYSILIILPVSYVEQAFFDFGQYRFLGWCKALKLACKNFFKTKIIYILVDFMIAL